MICVTKIISGGQIGADIAGLKAAKKLGLETGGWAPKGYRTETGSNTSLRDIYGLREDSSSNYPPRTKKNVASSDGTLIFGRSSPGVNLTIKSCQNFKPFFIVTYPVPKDEGIIILEDVADWLIDNNIKVLNIAGNRENKNPGIEKFVINFLIELLSERN